MDKIDQPEETLAPCQPGRHVPRVSDPLVEGKAQYMEVRREGMVAKQAHRANEILPNLFAQYPRFAGKKNPAGYSEICEVPERKTLNKELQL
jgi:hypothetical protein